MRDRSYALVEPGETKDIPDELVEAWPADLVLTTAPKPKPRTADDKRAMLGAMTDPELRAFVERVTGKKPHHKTGRAKLIEAALG